MGVCVLVLGKSGSGKSTSLRNFENGEVGVLSVLGKPLPFRKSLSSFNRPTYQQIIASLHKNSLNAYVIDDANYLMANENFSRAKERGYDKFIEMAQNFQTLIDTALSTNNDTIVYIMMHIDKDEFGNEKPKTIGKMIDEKYCIEGACPIVLDCVVQDRQHLFVTENNGQNCAKAPIDMLPAQMENDLKAVDTAIREYWGMKPLTNNNTEKEN